MKYSRIFRMFGVAVIMSLLLVAVPAFPAMATNDITLSVSSGKVGDTVTVTGTNFTPSTESSEKWVRVIFSSNSAIAGNYIDNHVITYEVVANAQVGEENMADEGDFTASFTIPSSLTDGSVGGTVTSGTYYIYVTLLGQTLIKSVSQFTIAAGEITISPATGPVDTALRIAGTGFIPSTAITIKYDNVAVTISDGDTVTNTSGNFDSYIYVPESVAGSHTITVIVGSSDVSKTFTVKPDIIISPQSGEAGTQVTVSCAGFSRRAQPIIYFNAYPVETLTGVIADTKGSFSTSFIVPEGLAAGVYLIEADDGSYVATASFNLNVAPPPEPTPGPEPTPTPGPSPEPSVKPQLSINASGDIIGSSIGIGGSGFTPGATVTVKYDDVEVTTVNADASGLVMAIFQAPPSKFGDHTITVSDGTNTNTITYTVESIAPEIPKPLLPEMGVKLKSPGLFDWEDVTDDSMPVTYNLQIATDMTFAEGSIVMDITDIETSGYTLTEVEELQLAGRADAYYWRVRALDAASNPSEWTGAGEFYISATGSNFPNWALYTLCGIGAVLLFGIGYWLGRRTAFYY
jgi:hypothetical protein